jgi:glycosyltransferase involved in cell wall biosynthesis
VKVVTKPLRVAIIADFLAEQWPSMDLIAETIVERLSNRHGAEIRPVLVRPAMARRFSRFTFGPRPRRLENADRLVGRFLDYPAAVRRLRDEFDVFHVTDHSYAHLVHDLPAAHTLVTCHDLGAFRCVLTPKEEPRSWAFRAMARRILSGLKLAARICCVSDATREDLLRFAIVPADRVTVVRNGVRPEFKPEVVGSAELEAARMLGPMDHAISELLHVGSTAPRKRIDVLLRVFAGVRKQWPDAKLVRVGGELAPDQAALAMRLGVHDAITTLPPLDRDVLAAVYRRAALLLITSDAEGFGLPVIEALACGAPVLASRIPALCEVGGTAAEYAPTGDVEAWVDKVNQMLAQRASDRARWAARQEAGLVRAREFSWDNAAAKLVDLYRAIMP